MNRRLLADAVRVLVAAGRYVEADAILARLIRGAL